MRNFVAVGLVLLVLSAAGAQETTPTGEFGGYSKLSIDKPCDIVGSLDGRIERLSGGVEIHLLPDDPERKPLPVRAEEIRFFYPEGSTGAPSRITLQGHVVIEHADATVKADQAEWDFDTGVLIFTGNPVMDGAFVKGVKGEKILLDFEKNTFQVDRGTVGVIEPGGKAADTSLLKESDVTDPVSFLTAFKKQCMAQEPSPGRHIVSLLKPEAKAAMDSMSIEQLLPMKNTLIKEINGILKRPNFYDEAAWQGIALPAEAAALLEARGARTLEPKEVTRLNRLLLEAAYPGKIKPAPAEPPPAENKETPKE